MLTPEISPGYGFAAIIVAFVGRLHPLGIVLASLLMSALYLGGESAQIELQLPASITGLFQGVLLFYLLAADLFITFRLRRVQATDARFARRRTRSTSRRPSTRQLTRMNLEQWIPIVASTVDRRDAADHRGTGRADLRARRRAEPGRRRHDAGRRSHRVRRRCLERQPRRSAISPPSSPAWRMSLMFGVLALTLQTNQVATGLALALFGVGLECIRRTSLRRHSDRARAAHCISRCYRTFPLLGPLLFQYDAVVYLSIALYFACRWFLYRSRAGLRLRAIGEAPRGRAFARRAGDSHSLPGRAVRRRNQRHSRAPTCRRHLRRCGSKA